MKKLKPADGRRLEALHYRVTLLRKVGVRIQPDQIHALKRVVDLLLADDRAAERAAHKEPPPGFGRMSPDGQN